jgi:hypothetical protein
MNKYTSGISSGNAAKITKNAQDIRKLEEKHRKLPGVYQNRGSGTSRGISRLQYGIFSFLSDLDLGAQTIEGIPTKGCWRYPLDK